MPKKFIEIGFFTGYSALAVALALPPDGTILAVDINAEWAKFEEDWFKQAGVRNKLNLRIQPAIEVLDELMALNEQREATGQAPEWFDFGFIDADKTGYLEYYEKLLSLIRPGGVIAIDNVFWLDRVAEIETYQDADTNAIRALNDRMAEDDRIEIAYIPTTDGVAICYKK